MKTANCCAVSGQLETEIPLPIDCIAAFTAPAVPYLHARIARIRVNRGNIRRISRNPQGKNPQPAKKKARHRAGL
jgi:hypothetical protein